MERKELLSELPEELPGFTPEETREACKAVATIMDAVAGDAVPNEEIIAAEQFLQLLRTQK